MAKIGWGEELQILIILQLCINYQLHQYPLHQLQAIALMTQIITFYLIFNTSIILSILREEILPAMLELGNLVKQLQVKLMVIWKLSSNGTTNQKKPNIHFSIKLKGNNLLRAMSFNLLSLKLVKTDGIQSWVNGCHKWH